MDWRGVLLDPTFEAYDPAVDGDRLRAAGSRGPVGANGRTLALAGLDVRPYAFQQEILDRLDAERQVHDRWRNLVVAATGTGMTVIAALDYRRLRDRPEAWRHVFASIQGLGTVLDGRFGAMGADQFDVVIVDEFHHAAAST